MKATLKIFSDNEETKTLYFDSKKAARTYQRSFLSSIHVSEKVKKNIFTRVDDHKSIEPLCTSPLK